MKTNDLNIGVLQKNIRAIQMRVVVYLLIR